MATTKSAILKRINSIRTRGARIDRDIHETGVDCMIHARDHGDVTLLTRLSEAMPKSSRRKAMVAWVIAHAPLKYNTNEEKFTLNKKRAKEDGAWQIEEAAATPFWEFTQEKAPVQYDLDKAINGLVRGLLRAHEQGNLLASRETVEQRIHEALVSDYPVNNANEA